MTSSAVDACIEYIVTDVQAEVQYTEACERKYDSIYELVVKSSILKR